jgi:hypothetical protein
VVLGEASQTCFLVALYTKEREKNTTITAHIYSLKTENKRKRIKKETVYQHIRQNT